MTTGASHAPERGRTDLRSRLHARSRARCRDRRLYQREGRHPARALLGRCRLDAGRRPRSTTISAASFDYDMIIKTIKDILAERPYQSGRDPGRRDRQHCLAHPRAARVTVKIEKLDKEPGAVGVEIVRPKGERLTMPGRTLRAPSQSRAACGRGAARSWSSLAAAWCARPSSTLGSMPSLQAPRPVVVVPGGGALADEVRACRAQLGFGDRRGPPHGAARHGSTRLGRRGLAPGLRGWRHRRCVARCARPRAGRGVGALRPGRRAHRHPQSWTITSDSLALWLARPHRRRALSISSSRSRGSAQRRSAPSSSPATASSMTPFPPC